HDFLRGSELIIHNAPFDIGFLNMEFSKMGLAPVEEIAENVIDTLVEAKRKYPGKRNSLDALCERLEVDRSKRVLHGALIDCDLLAQVYLAMTHNQFTLDIDLNSDSNTDGGQKSNIDYSARNFKIVMASADENKVHEAYLDKLSQTCTPIYRNEE
ncbi:MAG: exonuclease domain-containing protein, partial [Neisseriaceae bacterium]|nr:exonuclease domain-containing protein [Neisseriaceae bacterium]